MKSLLSPLHLVYFKKEMDEELANLAIEGVGKGVGVYFMTRKS